MILFEFGPDKYSSIYYIKNDCEFKLKQTNPNRIPYVAARRSVMQIEIQAALSNKNIRIAYKSRRSQCCIR